jgi:hypothetical protein
MVVAYHFDIIAPALEHLFEVISDSHIVPPVQVSLLPSCSSAHSFSLKIGRIRILVVLQSQSYSGVGQDHAVHPCLLSQPNINPASCTLLGGPIQSHSFPELAGVSGFEVVVTLNGVHEPCVLEIWVHLEQMFSEVLGGFKVLQISGYVLTRVEVLAFGVIAMVPEDDDFVDLEDGANACNFTDKVRPQG